MRELNRKSKTEIAEPISIPPLQLADIKVEEEPIRYKPTKEPLSFLKIAPLNHNQDFLKQKSLYRYTISRKLSRNSFNKSQTCLIQNSTLKHNKSELNMEIEPNKTVEIENRQRSIISKNSREGASKQRHFRRKTKTDLLQNTFPQFPLKENKESVIKQQRQNQRGKSNAFQQLCSNCENELKPLRIANNQMKRQMELLKEQNMKYSKDIEEKTSTIQMLNEENKKLLKQLKKIHPIHSDKFINENKLENELLQRGIFIKQLQEKVKYLQLQNLTLKKVKKEKDQQVSIIEKLQSKNRQLENRLKIMSALRTKRNMLKGSMMSSCSEISLNLSADHEDDELQKIYESLKTTERTYGKTDTPEPKGPFSHKNMDETKLSPWWSSQLKA